MGAQEVEEPVMGPREVPYVGDSRVLAAHASRVCAMDQPARMDRDRVERARQPGAPRLGEVLSRAGRY